MPSRSELLVEVTANGYFPTYKTVPTFATNVYAPIYLVSRDKVETITRSFTKSPQREQNGILMGRVFDPGTAPRKPVRRYISRSARKRFTSVSVAFSGPELSATSENGLFAFFNVTPSFRSLLHNEQPALLAQVRPGTADFMDLGRGGKRSLSGQIMDPFSGTMPPAAVKIVGEDRTRIETDEKGEFRIPEVDLPPGVVTLEVVAEGYPITWHTLPWNARERDQKRSLFMVEKDLVKEGAASVAHLKLERSRGTVIGGADASFFSHGETCVHVVLEDGNGNRLPQGTGPYPLKVGERTPIYRPDAPLCLSTGARLRLLQSSGGAVSPQVGECQGPRVPQPCVLRGREPGQRHRRLRALTADPAERRRLPWGTDWRSEDHCRVDGLSLGVEEVVLVALHQIGGQELAVEVLSGEAEAVVGGDGEQALHVLDLVLLDQAANPPHARVV